MSKNLSQENHVWIIRDGHRYRVTEIERLVGRTTRFSFVDITDGRLGQSYSMIQVMPEGFWEDFSEFQKMKKEQSIPGQQFVIEMGKNPDGTGQLEWNRATLRDPSDKRYA